jgi:hypothetical protein
MYCTYLEFRNKLRKTRHNFKASVLYMYIIVVGIILTVFIEFLLPFSNFTKKQRNPDPQRNSNVVSQNAAQVARKEFKSTESIFA